MVSLELPHQNTFFFFILEFIQKYCNCSVIERKKKKIFKVLHFLYAAHFVISINCCSELAHVQNRITKINNVFYFLRNLNVGSSSDIRIVLFISKISFIRRVIRCTITYGFVALWLHGSVTCGSVTYGFVAL